MIIVMKPDASQDTIDRLLGRIEDKGLKPLHMPGAERVVLGALGDERVLAELGLEAEPSVESVKPILAPYKLAARDLHPHDSRVKIGDVAIGGGRFALLGGPCAVESEEQLRASAKAAKAGGARILRGGAYKPRTSPYSFQGKGPEGLDLLRQVGDELDLPVVTEMVDARDLDLFVEKADAIQIGTRNMQNFELLKAVGECGKPVILKRGMAARIDDLLMAAEYVLAGGNEEVILCERGIRTFETATRNTLDLAAVPLLKEKTHLPVIVDPSHGTGKRSLVAPMALAAAAAGADGVMVEVHVDPATALSDGPQSLYPEQMEALGHQLSRLLHALGREL
ncbi:3-deoxy-7-phosphoheptulonate synthase [Sphingomicrobium astaxanthinifaciens]|uniref:3-deoxy-7-phosphoheptulonate synthase n=1 Tax=Sphingomicrobium astaxanthinifaciens TaxID=1227949 RepID=UPI001FCC1196|nr:3-deoxy-7-phosphoheptulonate synthase [Sphingomicrobium astaxanthinifaciens]MCJ7421204.1 3-deoxy-7-phosphoheptulonate synthase [Sphingomicrobium astaxanthinifaciens]